MKRIAHPRSRLARDWLRRLGQRLPWHTPTDTLEDRNIRSLYAETAWFGVLSGLAATFVSVYALRLGASTAQVGWLAALPALASVAWLVPAARMIERRRQRMPLILWTGLLQRLGYVTMAFVPFLPGAWPVRALVVLNTLLVLPSAVINTAITALLPDLTQPDRRGQVISVRWLVLAVTSTLAALLGGLFLERVPEPLNYQFLLGVGSALSLLSLLHLRRIRLPDAVILRGAPPAARQPRARRAWADLRQSLAAVLAQRQFVRFAGASFLFHWGLYLPAALWSVLRVRDLGASDAWIGLIAVVIDASTIAGYLFWGRVRALRGDRWLLLVTAAGVSAYALLTALVPTIAWMIPTSVLGGFAWSGCNLALFNVMLVVCPGERRPSYIALYTALINVTGFAGPLLGAGLASGTGIRWAFVVSGGVRAAGLLLFLLLLSGDHERLDRS